ncbi:hypothetical protein C427_0693 [Paraglaciecola psychrophila 170]|uniref:Uncharacterized protein n=1 Tax=Paraglaciecola psychrophila 170 TaxID=1129794 RepID=K6YVG1_9ALTE|nr:hypothetical protein C427_0693 [Paraglaciecola psychrophila 170]GAC36694.1 hypothetical protein GPSY_1056 [Paraglaciecola psychrophila 170]
MNSLAETYITKGDMDFLNYVGSPVKISSTVKLNNLAILTAKGKLGLTSFIDGIGGLWDTASAAGKSAWVQSRSALSTFKQFFVGISYYRLKY